ncbi:MAG TPA: hypothetical protein VFE05_24745 [Longimicrobiaceae bacterium]|jgi:hypothetical protein|nr:hypothetical protein [Longimicrobiaceae bacterium]
MKKMRLDLSAVDVETFAVLPPDLAEQSGTVRGQGNTWDPPTCAVTCGVTFCGGHTCDGAFSCADTCTETRPIRACNGPTFVCQ